MTLPPGLFVFDGADGDHIYYHTRSWTRPGITHDQWIDKENGLIYCTCEDASCRRKFGMLFHRTGHECKHIEALKQILRRFVE